MLFNASLLSAIALVGITQAMGASVQQPRDVAAVQIATSPYYACNAPNNEKHHAGSSCKYYSGPSDGSAVINGKCEYQGNQLNCVAT